MEGGVKLISSLDSFEKLEDLVVKKGMTFYRLGKETGLPSSFFSEWKKGKMMPKVDKLQKLAKYFDKETNYFLEPKKQHKKGGK